jgi:hypothetical protein
LLLNCHITKKKSSYPIAGLDSPFGLQEFQVPRINGKSAKVNSLFQSEFSTECELVLPLSSSNILFPECHAVAAYFFFLVFLSLNSFSDIFSRVQLG